MSDRDKYQEMIFNFVYVMAIRDAVMQKAYKGEKKWMWEVNEDEKMDDVKLCLKRTYKFNTVW